MSLWSDSDKNIIASLQHEGCEFHCEGCNACLTEADLDPEYGWCEDCIADSDANEEEPPMTALDVSYARAEANPRDGDKL